MTKLNRAPQTDHSERFALTCRRLRTANAISQRELSALMDKFGYSMSRASIQRLENGQRLPTLDDVYAYSHVFNIGIAQIMIGTDRFGIPYAGPHNHTERVEEKTR